MIVFIGMF